MRLAASGARARPADSTRRRAARRRARSARIVRAQISSGDAPSREFRAQSIDRHRQELPQRRERLRIGAPVVEHAEDAGHGELPAVDLAEKRSTAAASWCDTTCVRKNSPLKCPSPRNRTCVAASACGFAQPPSVRSGTCSRIASRSCQACSTHRGGPTVAIAAEDDERAEAFVPGALGVRETELERMLRREERHDAIARHVGPEIDDEVPEVLLFVRADGAVGQEHERPAAHEAAHRMVRVDPRVHAAAASSSARGGRSSTDRPASRSPARLRAHSASY